MTHNRIKKLVMSIDRILRDDGFSPKVHLDVLAKLTVVTIMSADKSKHAELKDTFRASVEEAFSLLGPFE